MEKIDNFANNVLRLVLRIGILFFLGSGPTTTEKYETYIEIGSTGFTVYIICI